MKKLNLLKIGFLVLGVILFTACKKDKSEPPASLIGTWNISSIESKTTENGKLISTFTYVGKANDFITFKNDNTIIYSLDGEKDNMTFEILPNNKLLMDGDIYTINTLTQNSCSLSLKTGDEQNFDEQIVNLKR